MRPANVLPAGVPHPSHDFGIELSVSCHSETSHGKQLSLERTSRGEDLRVLPKAKLGANHWTFLTAAVPFAGPAAAATQGGSTGSAGSSGSGFSAGGL